MTKRIARSLILIKVAVLMLTVGVVVAPPAIAADYCRQLGSHSVCIVSIQRSAKKYWEYRAAVRIDGIERPIELYNCRDRIRVQQDGAIVPFEPDGVGKLVCRLFKK